MTTVVVVVSIVLLNRVSLCHTRCRRLDRHRVVISVVESPNWDVVVVVVVGLVVSLLWWWWEFGWKRMSTMRT